MLNEVLKFILESLPQVLKWVIPGIIGSLSAILVDHWRYSLRDKKQRIFEGIKVLESEIRIKAELHFNESINSVSYLNIETEKFLSEKVIDNELSNYFSKIMEKYVAARNRDKMISKLKELRRSL